MVIPRRPGTSRSSCTPFVKTHRCTTLPGWAPFGDGAASKVAAAEYEGTAKLDDLQPSGELAVPIMEALSCGVRRELGAVIVPNQGLIPGIDDDIAVEVPAVADKNGIQPSQMERLPEAITAILRTQASIQKVLVEAYAEGSRRKLLQALLLDPTARSYRNAVALINEMCELQKELLPTMTW